jgi:hypothetical protein
LLLAFLEKSLLMLYEVGTGWVICDYKYNTMSNTLVRAMPSLRICQTFDLLDCVRLGLQTIDLLFASVFSRYAS